MLSTKFNSHSNKITVTRYLQFSIKENEIKDNLNDKKGCSQHPNALKTSYIFVSYLFCVLVTASNPHHFTAF